jgi:osmoprotectant transport system ATP-binding protein
MIEFRNVSKSYDGRLPAVDRLTLRVESGELLAIVGPSGCGKSTTLSMINRLEDPTEGTILINGTDTRDHDSVVLRRRIGFVFQDIGLFSHMTVGENASIVLRIARETRRNRCAGQ